MASKIQIINERLDEIVLLLHIMIKMELPQLLTKHLGRHWKQLGLDWGWVIVIWLAYIISEGDHRKVSVRDWVAARRQSLEMVCEISVREEDFTDDRLSLVLKYLSEETKWQEIEKELNKNTIRIYQLPVERIRLDATTVNGHHLVNEEGLFQFGHSKDDPSLPQVKVMLGSLDPMGLPLATWVVGGETADDGLYVPMFEQLQTIKEKEKSLLWVGDCKMSAMATRGRIERENDYYLTVLPKSQSNKELLLESLKECRLSDQVMQSVKHLGVKEKKSSVASGYELTRELKIEKESGLTQFWSERVLLVYTSSASQRQEKGLQQRLEKAITKIEALTPPPGRGRTQIRQETELHSKVQGILHQHQVEELLSYNYEYQVPTSTRQGRYQITEVNLNEESLKTVQAIFGWRIYVTNAPVAFLDWNQAVLAYRESWIVERDFARFNLNYSRRK